MKRPIRGNQYVKNHQFDFNFGGTWGTCSVTMTSVIGHLAGLEFERPFRGWASCPPGALFEAPVLESVDPVCERGSLMAYAVGRPG
jgi:DNA topoisomerase III